MIRDNLKSRESFSTPFFQRSVQAIAAEAQKRLHMQSQNNSFASSSTSKGRSPGERSSPSTPGAASGDARGAGGATGNGEQTGTGSTNGDGNNQQDWTFEEQFKQVRTFDVEIEDLRLVWSDHEAQVRAWRIWFMSNLIKIYWMDRPLTHNTH